MNKPDWAVEIRKTRIAHNYTQPQLAALLGVSLTLIQKIEAGTRIPSLINKILLAKYLNIRLEKWEFTNIEKHQLNEIKKFLKGENK